jgi:hypothetical protein
MSIFYRKDIVTAPYGKVPESQIPSFANDVIIVATFSNLPQPGEKDKLYLTSDNGKIYWWTGTVYKETPETVDGGTF